MKKLFCAIFCSILLAFSVASSIMAYEDITAEDVKQMLDAEEDIFILDVRQPEEYAQGYVPTAYLLPLGEIEQRLDEIPRDIPVIVICKIGARSAQAAQILDDNGFDSISNMAVGTMGWIDMPAYVNIKGQDLWDQLAAADAFILDVRDADKYEKEHIEVSISIPFNQMEDRLNEIPTDKLITVVGQDDSEGAMAAEKLIELGYTGVRSLEGGMRDWDLATAVSASEKMTTTFGVIKTSL